MLDNQSNNKRIAKNTLFLFIRMVIIMIVTLYTSRVILQSLGIEDYGIYNMVGGVTSMFLIIVGSLSNASQRFITFAIGKKNVNAVREVFTSSLFLHIFIGVAIIAIAEPVGLWIINNKLIIPSYKLDSAIWVFQFSLMSMLIMLISIPYNAMIIAHERMNIYAYISILDALGRLAVAYSLYLNADVDKLKLYGFLLLLLQVLIQLSYYMYCRFHFEECKLLFLKNKTLYKDMAKFASWAIFGNAAFICCNQGITLILGMFFPPFVSAARGIAVQVQGALVGLVRNFQTAINPQITKYYAADELNNMNQLVYTSSKLSFFLVLIPFIPILLNTDVILKVWLKNVPEYAVVFTQFMIVSTSLNTLINPLEDSIKATGNIKRFELYVYGTKILTLPISFALLRMGLSPVYAFVVLIASDIFSLLFSLLEANKQLGFSIKRYVHEILSRIIIVVIVSLMSAFIIHSCLDKSVLNIIVSIIGTVLFTIFFVWIIGLNSTERKSANKMIHTLISRFK